MLRTLLPCLALAAVAFVPLEPTATATPNPQDATIRAEPVAGNVHVLYGQGGNIGVSVGDDGAFLIDDQFAQLTSAILAEVAKLTDEDVVYLVNTHWHFDHTGGNENMGNAGVMLVAHENVRERMSTEQHMEAFDRTMPASPEIALPRITYGDTMTFYWNGDQVDVFHVPNAHTDGDSIIHFVEDDVFHMGDTFFEAGYPFIDTSSEGSIHGVIAAADAVLERSSEGTRIIPGHGSVTGPERLREYRAMLVDVRDRVQALIDDGKSRDEVIAAKPTAPHDGEWGYGFMKPDQWTGFVYDGMVDP